MPFKDPAQLQFEIGKLSDPDFLRNMSLSRANFEIAIGDPVLANLEDILDEINTLDKSKSYYVYCRSGARSAQAVQLMRDLGFNDTYNLLGGILEWEGGVIE